MTILYIDDDPDDTDFFCEAAAYLNDSDFLTSEKEKITCTTANNGCQAVDLLLTQEHLPDFIFLDINMPVMDGRQCLKYLKSTAKYAKIPVIMFSTSLSPDVNKELMTMGAHDCIRKPSKFNDLVKILSGIFYKAHALR